jgi:hypothetical protein
VAVFAEAAHQVESSRHAASLREADSPFDFAQGKLGAAVPTLCK